MPENLNTLQDRFPNNSMKAKEKPRTETKDIPKKEEPKKVVKNAVKKKKKGLFSKMSNEIIEDDAPSVGSYILYDVLIPALKDLIFDVICGGSEKMLYGSDYSRRSKNGKKGNYIPYNSIYSGKGSRSSDKSSKRKGSFNSTDYILETKQEAEDVLDRMIDYLQRFETVSVAEFLEFVDVTPDDYTATNWGWTDLRGASTQRIRGGYVVKLPRPEPLID